VNGHPFTQGPTVSTLDKPLRLLNENNERKNKKIYCRSTGNVKFVYQLSERLFMEAVVAGWPLCEPSHLVIKV
jgi:hypothetical protein